MLLSPVTAQRDKFGEIECTKLMVVDTAGKLRVVLSAKEEDFTDYWFTDNGGVSIVALDIVECGNAAVSTWHKNGNRQ